MSAATCKKKICKSELRLQSAWNNLPRGAEMLTSDRKSVKVLFPGNWNFEQGPDFKDAKLVIDGKELSGDVEVHKEVSEWFLHGHHNDENYRKVILHVLSLGSSSSKDLSGRLPFPAVLIGPDRKAQFPLTESEKFPNGTCVSFFSSVSDTKLQEIFAGAGMARFEGKSRSLLAEMIDSGSEQACLKHIFESCGYKKNREQFMELYERFSEHKDIDMKQGPAPVLWGESGLLPDPSCSRLDPEMELFVKRTWASWWQTRMTSRREIRWNKSGVRPLNTPERRIAGLSAILDLFSGRPLKFLSEKAASGIHPDDFAKYLSSGFPASDKLWERHVNFHRKFPRPFSLIGPDRMNDIAANVLLPSLHAFATIKKDGGLARFASDTWKLLPMPQMNRTVRTACHRWFMPPQRFRRIIKDNQTFHGAMHIYGIHCKDSTGDCASCGLGKFCEEQAHTS